MTLSEQFDLINEHREAVGRRKFYKRTAEQIKRDMALIDLLAPYGADPWARYSRTELSELAFDP